MTELVVNIDCKRFLVGDVVALQRCHFQIASGEFVALVGPSGAGKTALLNIVGGLDGDYQGSVAANGVAVDRSASHPARVGYMFQEPRLMPWLTVAENLELVLAADGETGRAAQLLGQVELAGREASYPGQLSGGMQRRVALARAFAIQPSLLLMDEPFVSLDEPTAQRLRGLLLDLWRDLRPTVLFVTHNLREAIALSDRVVFLSASPGRVVLELPVAIPRPRDLASLAIQKLYDQVLEQHPRILSGLPATARADTDCCPPSARRLA